MSNPAGRYERFQHDPFDDGWESSDPAPSPIKTSITPEKTRTIITCNDSPDVPFIHLIRESHGGKLYEPEFGTRMRGTGEYADLLEKRLRIAVRRFGLSTEAPVLDSSRFRVPPRKGDQVRLFEE